MKNIVRVTSDHPEFIKLIQMLDDELSKRNGLLQNQYTKYNKIEGLETVVVAYDDKFPAGCGCFKVFDQDSVEIKRMFVTIESRGSGIAKMILLELETWAREKEFKKAILETGLKQIEAMSLYAKMGYMKIENYGQYLGNSNSVCMSKDLT